MKNNLIVLFNNMYIKYPLIAKKTNLNIIYRLYKILNLKIIVGETILGNC